MSVRLSGEEPRATGRATISVCMIVRDEEERLPETLRSVSFADELIVVDGGSTDRTREIARSAGAVVVENPWPGFATQRNVAIDHASCDWILEVDADERVSDELRDDIVGWLSGPPPADVHLCVVPLRDHFLGAWLGPAAKYPRYRSRMFRRGVYRHDESRQVHEGIHPQERTWALKGDLRHERADRIGEALGDWWRYARLESAHVEPLPGAAAYAKAIVIRPLAKVAYRTLIDGAWRDGARGLLLVALDASSDAVVFARRATGHVPDRSTPPDLGFGRFITRVGPVRIVAVAPGEEALTWLQAARAAGADTALVTDAEIDGRHWLHVERVPRLGPLHTIRALETIAQMREIDQLVLGDVGSRFVRLLSSGARGALPPASLEDDPVRLIRVLVEKTRG